LGLNRNEQALNYLIKAYKIEPQNIKVWISFLRVDEFKNEPIVSEIKKMALEKIKNDPIDPSTNELKLLLKKV
jgi:hypothetical protein